MGQERHDLADKIFDRLTVVRYMGTGTGGRWICRCECGNVVIVRGNWLVKRTSRSCGCWKGELISEKLTKHGFAKDARGREKRSRPEYQTWSNVLRRCAPGEFCNKDYAGRGIKVCERWRLGEDGKSGFECFLDDMGLRPSSDHSIDRINNDGDYCPENCRWATRQEQCRNQRSNFLIHFRGRTITLAEAEGIAGVKRMTIRRRLDSGWTPEHAISVPTLAPGEQGNFRRRGFKHPYREARSFSEEPAK